MLNLIASTAIIMNFAAERHAYYLLPLLAPMIVLLSDALQIFCRHFRHVVSARLLLWLAILHFFGALACVGVMDWLRPGNAELLTTTNLAAAAGFATVAVLGFMMRKLLQSDPAALALFLGVTFAVGILAIASNGLFASAEREQEVRLATAAADYVLEDTPLVVFDFTYSAAIYYSRRSPIYCPNLDAVREVLSAAPSGNIVCLASARARRELEAEFITVELAESLPVSESGSDALLRVTISGSSEDLSS